MVLSLHGNVRNHMIFKYSKLFADVVGEVDRL